MSIKPFKEEKLTNRKKVPIIIIGALAVLFLMGLIYQSFAIYEIKNTEVIVDSTIGSLADIKIIGIYIDNVLQSGMTNLPTDKTYDKIECKSGGIVNNDVIGEWDYSNKYLILREITKKTDCNVYFKNAPSSTILKNAIIADNGGEATILGRVRWTHLVGQLSKLN